MSEKLRKITSMQHWSLKWISQTEGHAGLPDALPRCFVSLKPMVTAKHNIINIQFISGIYICPCTLDDVCTIFTRGKQPRAEHCFMMEKVPVMTAWLPTTAASIAIARTGHLNCSGREDKNAVKLTDAVLCFTISRVRSNYLEQIHRIQFYIHFQYRDV